MEWTYLHIFSKSHCAPSFLHVFLRTRCEIIIPCLGVDASLFILKTAHSARFQLFFTWSYKKIQEALLCCLSCKKQWASEPDSLNGPVYLTYWVSILIVGPSTSVYPSGSGSLPELGIIVWIMYVHCCHKSKYSLFILQRPTNNQSCFPEVNII